MTVGAEEVLIVGAGNQGALLYDSLMGDDRWHPTGFVDDGKVGGSLNGLPIIGTDNSTLVRGRRAFLAFGFPDLRKKLVDKLSTLDIEWQTFIDRRSFVGYQAEIGRGTVILSFAMVASGVSIGPFCYVSAHSRIGTGAAIGPYTSVMGGSTVGNANIGAQCVLGINSTCIDGAFLGDGVTVAPYTLVRRSVPDGALVAGQPARVFARQPKKG